MFFASKVEKPCSSKPQELLLYPAKGINQSPTPPSAATPPTQITSPSHQKKPQTQRPSPTSQPRSSVTSEGLPPDLRQRLGELLLKYSSGLWAHALPKLYQDTYKSKLPEFVLDNLTLLSDICTIDYPVPDNPKRAILYAKVVEDKNHNQSGSSDLQTTERRLSIQTVPPLIIPREEYPSVLVVEAADTNSVILRCDIIHFVHRSTVFFGEMFLCL